MQVLLSTATSILPYLMLNELNSTVILVFKTLYELFKAGDS